MDTPLFRKADNFFSPFSTWIVHSSLDNADAHFLLRKFVRHGWSIQQLDIISSSIGSYSSSLSSAFLASVQEEL